MKILTLSDISTRHLDGSVVTIGNFDGVHRGHTEIFHLLREKSRLLGLPSVVVTFDPHPLKLIAPEKAPLLITTPEQKYSLISETDVDFLVIIEFSVAFSHISAESFVSDFLCRSLGMRHIIIGHDYAFGRGRQGNVETLALMGAEFGFTIENISPVGDGRITYSSSLVRRLVAEGDVAAVTGILGRYHVVSGKVVHGRKIGKMLGFPTANVTTSNELVPADGVYAVMVAVGGDFYQGACSIGTNPSFGGIERSIEVFILDYSGELYERRLSICFVQRLREVRKYSDASELIEAISRDVAAARVILDSVDRTLIKPLFLNGVAEGVE